MNKEEIVERVGNFVRKIKEDRRFFGISIVLVVLILIGVGSFTGNMIMKSKSVENELGISRAELETCQKNLEELISTTTKLSEQVATLEENISLSTADLNRCMMEKENYKYSFENCLELKNQTSAELKICKDDLITVLNDLDEYEKLLRDCKNLETNFAKSECCPNYDYYTVTDEENILCCYENEGIYFCGAGEETSENEIEELSC